VKTIQIFDPSLCCSTGVCDAEVDQELVRFAADAAWAREQGIQVDRINLAQQPLEFANNPLVKAVLQSSLAATDTKAPLLRLRAEREWPQINAVRERHGSRVALVALQDCEPIGVERLRALVRAGNESVRTAQVA